MKINLIFLNLHSFQIFKRLAGEAVVVGLCTSNFSNKFWFELLKMLFAPQKTQI